MSPAQYLAPDAKPTIWAPQTTHNHATIAMFSLIFLKWRRYWRFCTRVWMFFAVLDAVTTLEMIS